MAAAHFDRVFFCGWTQIEHRFIGTGNPPYFGFRRDFTGFDWPLLPRPRRVPYGLSSASLAKSILPGLRGAWHNVVVVGADKLGHHVVIETLHLFTIGNVDAFGPFYRNGLRVLEPILHPPPRRCGLRLLIMQDSGTRFSPACLLAATLGFRSW